MKAVLKLQPQPFTLQPFSQLQEKLTVCDSCSAGWHYDCLTPPLRAPPEGSWRCRACRISTQMAKGKRGRRPNKVGWHARPCCYKPHRVCMQVAKGKRGRRPSKVGWCARHCYLVSN
ncbi:hypothetical protein JKP88DRAFT_160551 [Tribonema minus]|uniref:Zinc finger PHD-type domain-containing protein n=1 Tax=Tribonema minus TaxID=303371 RepID=A0A835ZC80_9STRA|nr:hypothetical protein JKP88DRAFT_160551 [Tribonema minus]